MRSHRGRLVGVGVLVAACLVVSLGTPPSMALQPAASVAPERELPSFPEAFSISFLQISVDVGYKVVKAGDPVLYNTVVTNNGAVESPPLVVAMNIINLDAAADVVDPEDWSPQRTQYVKPLAPGQSVKLSWRVNAILDGDHMVYMVVIPKPHGQEATSHPVVSSGIHLTVTPFTKLNPRGVLPYAIGGPILVALGLFFVYRLRQRQIDTGGSS